MIRIIISGACGRMGKRIASVAESHDDLEIVGALERQRHPLIGKELSKGIKLEQDLNEVMRDDVTLIDFSTPDSTIEHIKIAVENRIPVVVGTTGFREDQEVFISQAAQQIPILKSHNYGIGMNAFYEIIRIATKFLMTDFEVEIIEFHGADKPDVPSGTGMTIAHIIAEEYGKNFDDIIRFGRQKASDSKRRNQEICMHSLRAGSYRSDHSVIFAGNGERLEFTHREEDTNIIAIGVIQGIRFLQGKSPGLYGMRDVMGFVSHSF